MKHSITMGKTSFLALAALAALAFAFNTHADTRGATGRTLSTSGRVTVSAPASSDPTPTPFPALSPHWSGGISNVTDGDVNSGGNSGGTVVTGDEHVEVHEVNIGPTNTPPVTPVVEEPAPTPAPQCDPRTREGCPTQNAGRAR